MTAAEHARLAAELNKLACNLRCQPPQIAPQQPQKPPEPTPCINEPRAAVTQTSPGHTAAEQQRLLNLARALKDQHGEVFARRWLASQLDLNPEHPYSNATEEKTDEDDAELNEETLSSAHKEATALLESDREALGPAYASLLLLATLSLDQAIPEDPAPHLQTTLWVLSEMSGKNIRTLQRHLLETQHTWSSVVSNWLDIRPVFGRYIAGVDKLTGEVMSKPRYVGVVYRFFPRTRQSARAQVGRFRPRNLIAASDAGQTQFSRPQEIQEQVTRERYRRGDGLMSPHSSPKEQIATYNWYLENLSLPAVSKDKPANVCNDIPRRRVLDVLLSEREQLLEQTAQRGASSARARTKWVETAAYALAETFNDHGFINLWRKVLWVATKAELYGATTAGWRLIQRMIDLADEGKHQPGLRRPVAYAYTQVKEAVEAFDRDYGAERAGTILV
jgi:hypothetical protein